MQNANDWLAAMSNGSPTTGNNGIRNRDLPCRRADTLIEMRYRRVRESRRDPVLRGIEEVVGSVLSLCQHTANFMADWRAGGAQAARLYTIGCRSGSLPDAS